MGWAPFDIIDRTGRHDGISADYLSLVAQRLGIQVEPVMLPDWQSLIAAVKAHQVDLLVSVAQTADREDFLAFTQPYITSSNVLFARRDNTAIRSLKSLAGKTVAIERGYALSEVLPKVVPGINLMPVADTEAALRAVSGGRADAYVGDLIVSSYLIERLNLTNLAPHAEAGLSTSALHFAVRKDWPELAVLLDRAIDTIGDRDRRAIRDRWLPSLAEIDWAKVAKDYWPLPAPNPLPVIVIGRLAVDRTYAGRKIGRALLRDAILRSLTAATEIGIRAILVHAVDDAASGFYRKFGFQDSPTDARTFLLPIEIAKANLQG